MKIKRISIVNFKSIEKLDFEFNTVTTALIAKNGTGKTAFKEAFYAAITGDFPDNCIRAGEETCSVAITLDDDTVIERIQNRTKANKVLIDGKATTAKVLNELIATKTSLTKDVLKIVASTDVMQKMQPSEFGSFVTAYIPQKLDYAFVRSKIPAISADAEKVLMAALPAMPDKFPLSKLAEIHSEFMEQRKLAKRDLATITAKVNSFTGAEPARTLKVIEEDMNELLRKDGAQKSAKVAVNLYNSAVENRRVAVENLEKLKAKIDGIVATRPNPVILDKIKTERQDAQKSIVNAKTTLNTTKENIRIFENTIANLNKPVCPISEKLVCTTDKTAIKEELSTLIESNKEAIAIQEGIIKTNEEKIAELDKKENEYRANEVAYKEKTTLVNRYEEQRKNIPALPPKPDSCMVVDYTAAVNKIKQERDGAIAYEQHLKDIEDMKVKENWVTIYDFLCNTFNAKGDVMNTIMAHYLGIFETTCNTTANALRPGFEFKFYAEDGISYLVRTSPAKKFTKFDGLSSGEQLLTLFILMDMFSLLTSSKLMILDDLDKLDNDAFKELLELIQSPAVQAKYDHIMFGAVNHNEIVDAVKTYGIDMVY